VKKEENILLLLDIGYFHINIIKLIILGGGGGNCNDALVKIFARRQIKISSPRISFLKIGAGGTFERLSELYEL